MSILLCERAMGENQKDLVWKTDKSNACPTEQQASSQWRWLICRNADLNPSKTCSSPDLASSDCYLFLKMKKLIGQYFETDDNCCGSLECSGIRGNIPTTKYNTLSFGDAQYYFVYSHPFSYSIQLNTLLISHSH